MLGSSPNDFTDFTTKLTTNYNVRFSNPQELNYQRAKDIFDRCVELRWSRYEFQKRLSEFLDTHKWFNFTRADFIAMERKKLYPRSWYAEEVAKNPNAKFEAYYVGAEIMYRYYSPIPIRGLKPVEWFNTAKPIDENHRLEQSHEDAKITYQKVSELCEKYGFKNPLGNLAN